MNNPRLLAFIAVLVFFFLAWRYVREFAVLSNTIGVRTLALGSVVVALALAGGALWRWRERFTPLDRHVPEVLFILIFSALFAPLFGSLLNRSLGRNGEQSFEFVAETAYYASGYGILKGEKLKPTGWRLTVRDRGQERRFKYKTQAYFPLTQPGETVLLPMRYGIFGVNVVCLGN